MDGECVMAKISFSKQKQFTLEWKNLEEAFLTDEQLKRVVYAGAEVVADQIRSDLEKMQEERFRFLRDDDVFGGTPEGHRRDLEKSFGLSPIKRDKDGFIHTKAGFEGYGSFPTKTYPQGIPNALLARAIESGSSVRHKLPFVAPAVRKTKAAAITAMDEKIDEIVEEIFKEL